MLSCNRYRCVGGAGRRRFAKAHPSSSGTLVVSGFRAGKDQARRVSREGNKLLCEGQQLVAASGALQLDVGGVPQESTPAGRTWATGSAPASGS